ncbi:MAG: 2-hydroxyhepta-2,4-diene-1,7-dioate isomerase [Chloroflexi bacterium]|nr:2-hydroxyhepta-2,4-diene-1,7-dioate isomerase [Chloroflexota bacterium]
MNDPLLVRYFHPNYGPRLGVRSDEKVHDVHSKYPTLTAWLKSSMGRVESAIEEILQAGRTSLLTFPAAIFENIPAENIPHWLAPIDEQDVWAAGVTYERSKVARQEESQDGGDVYARVYRAERPELFFKARGRWVVGVHAGVGIRSDATWSVPEPELGLVINPAMEMVGFTVGNDMSSRDIEGENPLYLPQAKVYTASCAIGPGILLKSTADWPDTSIHIHIRRGGEVAFEGAVHTSRIKRTIPELVDYLGRSNAYPEGVVLLTGTGVVPPGEFTLQAGDEVQIEIEGIGTLINTVKVV